MASSSRESQEPFLDPEKNLSTSTLSDAYGLNSKGDYLSLGHKVKRRWPSRWFWIHCAVIFGYTVLFGLGWKFWHTGGCTGYELIYSPAKEAIRPVKHTFVTELENNPYAGLPRPELDEAWAKLLRNANLRITEDELKALGGNSIPLADGTGYVAELGIHHELHCIKRVRQAFHFLYYHPNATDEDFEIERVHIDHCLEYFREAAICRGDPSLTTFGYRISDGRPVAHQQSEHQCVEWEPLDKWAEDRFVDVGAGALAPMPTGYEKNHCAFREEVLGDKNCHEDST